MPIIIQNGRVFNSKSMNLESSDLLIENDRITAMGPHLSVPECGRRIDATGQLILPGLINAHTHAHNNLMKGLADNWTLEDLLNYGTSLYSNRTVEDQYITAAIGAVEMLKTGCTSAYDMFVAIPAPTEAEFEAVVRAYTDVGMRAVVAPAVADIAFYQTIPGLFDLLPSDLRQAVEGMRSAPAEGLLRMNENGIRTWDGSAAGRIHVAVAPSIPGQCTDAFLSGCLKLVREYGVSFHTHLVETKIQAVYASRRWGKTVVGHLDEMGLLGPHFVGAHSVWLTDEDIRRLADRGSLIAHNPASNLKLGSGISPIREMLDRGITVGLGTDGSMSSDNQNLFEAMRLAALVSKVRAPHRPDRWVGAADVWKMASSGSAKVLGLANDIGSIAPGWKADLILLQADSVFLRPLNHVVNALVYAETGADVTTVLVNGRVILEKGQLLTLDEGRLRNKAQEAAERVRHQNREIRAFAEKMAPYLSAANQEVIKTPFPVNRYASPIPE